MGTETELVRNLLNLNFRTVRSRHSKMCIRLAVLLDIRVNSRLLRVIPYLPIRLGHHRSVNPKRDGRCRRAKE